MNRKNFERKLFGLIAGGALFISVFPALTQAFGSTGDRYGCIAKVEGRYFTNGAETMKEFPCEVAPAAVDSLAKAKKADKKTDQVNFDYFWSQEYYTTGDFLTDISQIEAIKSGQALPPAAAAVPQKDNPEASAALLKTKTAAGFDAEQDTAGIDGQFFSVRQPFNGVNFYNAAAQSAANNAQMPLYTSAANNAKR